jgi:hypothetical protein
MESQRSIDTCTRASDTKVTDSCFRKQNRSKFNKCDDVLGLFSVCKSYYIMLQVCKEQNKKTRVPYYTTIKKIIDDKVIS